MKTEQVIYQASFFALVLIIAGCQVQEPTADKIVINAVIWTGNQNQPAAEAMAIKGDSIVFMGSTKQVQQYQGPSAEVIDAGGKFIAPGFIDTHVHFI